MVRLMLGSYNSQQCFQLACTIRQGVKQFCETTAHDEKCMDCQYSRSCLELLSAADYADEQGKVKAVSK